MASNPPYDPNRDPRRISKLNTNEIETPLLNRATQGQYPPGSTFKVVTAAAGLESGTITPETPIDAPGALEVEGHAAGKRLRRELPGDDPLDTALTNSVNTWFGQLGQQVGEDTLFEYMEKFGFNSTPADRPARRRGLQERRLRRRRRTAERQRPGRPGPGGDRPGAAAGDAAADGAMVAAAVANKRQADEAADLEPGGRPRRPRHQTARPLRVQPADQRRDRRRADHRDGRRGQRRDRDQRGDLRASRSPARPAPRKRRATRPAAAAPKRTRPGSWASPRPTTRRSRSRPRSSARTEFGNDVAAPIFRDVAEAILNGE